MIFITNRQYQINVSSENSTLFPPPPKRFSLSKLSYCQLQFCFFSVFFVVVLFCYYLIIASIRSSFWRYALFTITIGKILCTCDRKLGKRLIFISYENACGIVYDLAQLFCWPHYRFFFSESLGNNHLLGDNQTIK